MQHHFALGSGLATASALAVSLLAAHPLQPGALPGLGSLPGQALSCQIEPAPGGGSVVRLGNPAGPGLPAQQRLAWASLGTPAPVGEWRQLPVPLAAGAQLLLHTRLPPRGSGCVARAATG